jgi:RNA polymerase sigma-70 factor, ECF subfamily
VATGHPSGVTVPSEVAGAVAAAYEDEWANVLAATARAVRNLDVAEEAVQEAFTTALTTWARDGVPSRPGAWLTTVARRRALDVLRRETTLQPKLALLVEQDHNDGFLHDNDESVIVSDDRLRLIFLCCHPALSLDAQLALTLRLVCGISTPDVARALLVTTPTMAARLTRAKRKIAVAGIPMRIPPREELSTRLSAVLAVVYQLFTAGHTAPSGAALQRGDLADEAIRLARGVRDLLPRETQVDGLLALMLAIDARRSSRVDATGQAVDLAHQDRSTWDISMINEARAILARLSQNARSNAFAVQAEIALVHAMAPSLADTNWNTIVHLYDALMTIDPSPVTALNRAVAIGMAGQPIHALVEVERLESEGHLATYRYVAVVKADLLWQVGEYDDAREMLLLAIAESTNDAERGHLERLFAERFASDGS